MSETNIGGSVQGDWTGGTTVGLGEISVEHGPEGVSIGLVVGSGTFSPEVSASSSVTGVVQLNGPTAATCPECGGSLAGDGHCPECNPRA